MELEKCRGPARGTSPRLGCQLLWGETSLEGASANIDFSLKARTSRQNPQSQWGGGVDSFLFYIASICPLFPQGYRVKSGDGGRVVHPSDK